MERWIRLNFNSFSSSLNLNGKTNELIILRLKYFASKKGARFWFYILRFFLLSIRVEWWWDGLLLSQVDSFRFAQWISLTYPVLNDP